MIARAKETPNNAMILDRDSAGFIYFEINPDMPFPPITDIEIISS